MIVCIAETVPIMETAVHNVPENQKRTAGHAADAALSALTIRKKYVLYWQSLLMCVTAVPKEMNVLWKNICTVHRVHSVNTSKSEANPVRDLTLLKPN